MLRSVGNTFGLESGDDLIELILAHFEGVVQAWDGRPRREIQDRLANVNRRE
jgi:hypothetical protein